MNGKELQGIINKYKQWRENHVDELLQDCSNGVDLKKVIDMAATARGNNGKRHNHQRRWPNEVLNEFCRQITSRAEELSATESFDQIYELVKECRLKGVADLTIYDTALRIGSFLNIYPNKIFLHRGTLTGAKNLLGKVTGPFITMNQLPRELQGSGLSPAEVEDFLCHFKGELSYYK